MRRRMAALTALCMTGSLVLSGGWSQTAMASTVSEHAEDAVTEQPDETEHSDASQNADESEQTQTDESPSINGAGGVDGENGTDGVDGTDQPQQDAQTPEADAEQNPQTDESPNADEEQNPQIEETTDDQEEIPDEDAIEDPELLNQKEEQKVVGSYQGITIDGDFSDWDAVAKTPVTTGGVLTETAMVWDGDYVYLYFKENTKIWNAITWDGAYSNGQFAITTDMGRSVLVRLSHRNNSEPCVNGVDGAKVAVDSTAWGQDSYQWEVSIPSSELPKYKQTISFGLYQGATFIQNVANLQGDPDADNNNFSGITYDGLYGDWDYYPHVLLNYATPGTQEKVVDADGAMYASDGKLYAHVVTNMPAHLQEAGGEFTSAVTIRINGDKMFYPRFLAVAADGTINFNSDVSSLSPGTYEFYMFDANGWKMEDRGVTNISQLQANGSKGARFDNGHIYFNEHGNGVYGKMYVTISPSEDNMEFEIDLDSVAKLLGMSTDEIRTLEGQWGRIGQQWVTTAGTPTGAGMGLFLCLSTTGVVYLAQRKRKKQV